MEGRAARWGTPDRFDPSLFLYELVRATRPRTVIELGTAYGQGSLHILLALAENQEGHLHTVELDPHRRERALAAFARFPELDRVTSIEGDMREHAGPLAARSAPVDLLFEDGPHDGPTTLAAFEATIDHVRPGGLYVADDIAQEPEQEVAWARIRSDPRLQGTLEINERHGVCVRA
jgi:predicted O-methyltransferase YrrM